MSTEAQVKLISSDKESFDVAQDVARRVLAAAAAMGLTSIACAPPA